MGLIFADFVPQNFPLYYNIVVHFLGEIQHLGNQNCVHKNNISISMYLILCCHRVSERCCSIMFCCYPCGFFVRQTNVNSNKACFQQSLSGYSFTNSCRAIRLLFPPIVSYTYPCGCLLSKLSLLLRCIRPTIGLTREVGLSTISFLRQSMKTRSGFLRHLLPEG